MSKHTPGPWELWGTASPSQVIAAENYFVAQTLGRNDEANARLIAAAPDLLDALKDLKAQVETFCAQFGESDFETGRAAAAIAKAEEA